MDPREPKKTPRWTKDVYMAPQGSSRRSKGVKVEARELQKLEKFVPRNHFKTIGFYSKIEHLEVTVRQCMPLLEFIWYFNASRRHGDVVEDLWWSLVSSGNALGEHMGRLVSQEDVQR